ncbi:MAG: PAS domain S-box protein [Ignavibacteriales bacterium]|nr:PAS domain S-box protein [Ignavibacteriales bacterium]
MKRKTSSLREEDLSLAGRELRIVEKLAQSIVRKQEVRRVMQRLAEELVRFGFRATVVTELDQRRGGFRILGVAPQTRVLRLVSKVLNIRLDRYVFPFRPQQNDVLRTLVKGRTWIGRDMGEIVRPTLSPRLARTVQKLLGIRSIYNSPLMSEGKIVGSVIVGTDAYSFSQREQSFLKTITHHAALIIHQALLLSENLRKTEQYRLLGTVDRHILEEKQLAKVLSAVVENIQTIIPCDLAGIYLYDPKEKVLVPTVTSKQSRFSRKLAEFTIPWGKGILGSVARTRKAVIVNNAQKDPRSIYPGREKPSLEHLLCVPLITAGDMVGIMNVARFHDEPFMEGDLEIARPFGEKSALAIGNARLLQALGDSEKKFRRLFEESKDAIYISTPQGKLLDINNAAVVLFGFQTREEMLKVDIGRDLYVNPADRKALVRDLEKFGFLKDVELRLKKKDGTRILVYAMITVIRDATGRVTAFQGILRDVTKQKEGERLLHESEEKYRSLVEDSLVGVYILQEGRFVFVNRRFAEMFGYSVTDLVRKRIAPDSLVHPEDRWTAWASLLQRVSGEGKGVQLSFRGMRKNGEMLEIELYGTASVYLGSPAVIGTVLDRTQEHRQQKEISDWRRRYELIIASSGQIVYEYDITTGRILWSGSIERVLGYSLAEIRGDIDEWESLIHPDDRGAALRDLDQAMKTMAPYDVEYRYRRKDGRKSWRSGFAHRS